MNRPGSGQPDEFATRGRCEKRLPEHLHRRVPFFCVVLSVASLDVLIPDLTRVATAVKPG